MREIKNSSTIRFPDFSANGGYTSTVVASRYRYRFNGYHVFTSKRVLLYVKRRLIRNQILDVHLEGHLVRHEFCSISSENGTRKGIRCAKNHITNIVMMILAITCKIFCPCPSCAFDAVPIPHFKTGSTLSSRQIEKKNLSGQLYTCAAAAFVHARRTRAKNFNFTFAYRFGPVPE